MDATEKQRTLQQNASIHLYLKQLSDELNKEGCTFSTYIRSRPRLELKWTPFLTKEVWHECQRLLYGKKSTAELSTAEVTHVYETMSRAMSETTGIDNIPFPSFETLIQE